MKPAHLNPEEAVLVLQDLKAQYALAIHWGTFEDLTDESLDQPPQLLQKSLKQYHIEKLRFKVVRHGQTLIWQDSEFYVAQ